MQKEQLVYSLHAVEALLEHSLQQVNEILVARERHDKRMQQLLQQCADAGIKVTKIRREQLNQMLPDCNHQGIVARINAAQQIYAEPDLIELIKQSTQPPLLLILDGVQDPHNLGACIRSANAAGVTAVIAPKDRAVGITPVVRKVACGAAEITPFIQVTNLARTMKKLQQAGVWIYGASAEAEQEIYKVDMTGPSALVLGAEGNGLRQLTAKTCDGLFKISMCGTVSSLNVSVATGICLFEVIRQRQFNG